MVTRLQQCVEQLDELQDATAAVAARDAGVPLTDREKALCWYSRECMDGVRAAAGLACGTLTALVDSYGQYTHNLWRTWCVRICSCVYVFGVNGSVCECGVCR